jgi:hypothetical protein
VLSAATFVIHVIVALFVVMLVAVTLVMSGADAFAQLLVVGVTVYTVIPVLWERTALSMPPLQDRITLPPPLDVATERS